jgi:hypothetical protein
MKCRSYAGGCERWRADKLPRAWNGSRGWSGVCVCVCGARADLDGPVGFSPTTKLGCHQGPLNPLSTAAQACLLRALRRLLRRIHWIAAPISQLDGSIVSTLQSWTQTVRLINATVQGSTGTPSGTLRGILWPDAVWAWAGWQSGLPWAMNHKPAAILRWRVHT